MSLSDNLSQFLEAAEAAEAAKAAKVAKVASAADPAVNADSPVPRKGNQKPAGTKLSLEAIEAGVVQTLATPKHVAEKGVEGMAQYIKNRYNRNDVEDIPAKYSGFVNAATEEKLQALVAQATEAFQANKGSRAPAKATPGAAAAATPAAAAATPAAAAAAAKASRDATKQKRDKKEPRKDAGSQKPYSKGNAGNKVHAELGEHAGNPEVKQLLSDIKSLNQQLHSFNQQLHGKQGALAALVKKLDEEAAAAAAAAATAAAVPAPVPAPAPAPAPVPASRFINVAVRVIPMMTPEKLLEMVRAKMTEMNVTNSLDVISQEQQDALTEKQLALLPL
jgi:hypothetical protein